MSSSGSIWRKIDFHVHTPYSFLNNRDFKAGAESLKQNYTHLKDKPKLDIEDIWEIYLDELERKAIEKNVQGIGICDYFTIEGYQKVKSSQESGRFAGIYLFPNLELRLNITTTSGSPIELHLIFSNQLPVNRILNLLHSLKFSYHERDFLCVRESLIELGKIFEGSNYKPDEFYLKEGMNQFKCNFNDIKDFLKNNSDVKNNVLLVVPNNSDTGLSGVKDGNFEAFKQSVGQNVDLIFSGSQNDIDYYLGCKKNEDPQEPIYKYLGYKGCIWGSDAHGFDKLFEPDEQHYTWVKADLVWEGIKQIKYVPQERVFIGPEPNYKPKQFSIKSLEISNSVVNETLSIDPTQINLNSQLIAVIGGKGAGKTALLDLIAHHYLKRTISDLPKKSRLPKTSSNVTPLENSFIARIQEEKPDLHTKITHIDNTVFEKNIADEEYLQTHKIKYLPQGKIEETCCDRDNLHNLIMGMIFENLRAKSHQKIGEYERCDNEINNFVYQIKDLNNKIDDLKRKTDKSIEDECNAQIASLNTKLLAKQIELVAIDKEKDATSQRIQYLTMQLGSWSKLNIDLQNAITYIGEIASLADAIEIELNEKINNYNLFVKKISQLQDISLEQIEFTKQRDHWQSVRSQLEMTIKKNVVEIENSSKELDLFRANQSYLVAINEEIKNTKGGIEDFQQKLNVFNQNKQELIRNQDERLKKYFSLLKCIYNKRELYRELIEFYSAKIASILKGITFGSEIIFNEQTIKDRGYEYLDKRKINSNEFEGKISTLFDILKTNSDISAKVKIDITAQISELIKYSIHKKTSCSELDFENWLFDNYFEVRTSIKFNNTPLEKLSLGQKGIVLIKLYLAEGEDPLIIDQPEENLDNISIYDTLVDAFLEAKKNRQVIISTHNANLVINTDAEQIIIASMNDGKISYSPGTIEDLRIRKQLTDILEGGVDAFKKRERRYEYSL